MKKVLSVVLAVILASTMVACGEGNTKGTVESTVSVAEVSESKIVVESEVSEVSVEESIEIIENKEEAPEIADIPDWKAFLKEYEDWVDEYIEIMKKYSENPADLSILGDYTEMLTEMAEWTEKTEDMEKSLEKASTEELLEYSSELIRIAAKITESVY